MSRPRVAFVFAKDASVPDGGTDLRVQVLLRAIEAEADVEDVLAGLRDRPGSRLGRALGRALAACAGVPPRLSQQYDRGASRAARDRFGDVDLVLAATTFSLPYVPRRLRRCTVLDAHNVESRVVAQLADHDASRVRRAVYRMTTAWTARAEGRAAAGVGQVWAVSDDEAEWFRSAGARDVVVVPNGVTLPLRRARGAGSTVLFVASFGSLFNQQALAWFLEQVWPLVLEAAPSASLVLVGQGSDAMTGPRVDGRGFVPDLDEVYSAARVAIAPIRSGAGTRLKVLEGLAHGVPVVATTLGAAGLDLVPGLDYVRADDALDFAAAVVRLLEDDPWHAEVVAHGSRAVTERYGWDGIAAAAAASALRLCSAPKL